MLTHRNPSISAGQTDGFMSLHALFKSNSNPDAERYIDIQGLPLGRGENRVAALISSPDIIANTTLSAVAAFSAAGTLSPGLALTLGLHCAASAGLGSLAGRGILYFGDHLVGKKSGTCMTHFAIDTKGERVLPRPPQNMRGHINSFEKYTRIMAIGASALALLIHAPYLQNAAQDLVQMILPNPFALVPLAFPLTMSLSLGMGWLRASRVRSGRYTLSAKPS